MVSISYHQTELKASQFSVFHVLKSTDFDPFTSVVPLASISKKATVLYALPIFPKRQLCFWCRLITDTCLLLISEGSQWEITEMTVL